MTYSDLLDIIGEDNMASVLWANMIAKDPNQGYAIVMAHDDAAWNEDIEVTESQKITVLNSLRFDSELFEKAALMSEEDWRTYIVFNAFRYTLTIPDSVALKDLSKVQGSGVPIDDEIANSVITQIQETGQIDPTVFNSYSNTQIGATVSPEISTTSSTVDVFQYFKIPWREVTLYSSLADAGVDFPVYPESISDKITATYDTMPDILYQYEPWYVYKNSGPRENSYTFDFHRDMWTGDHRDNKALQLVQFCKANCYPRYQGAAVNVSTVTLYIGKHPIITGILTAVEDEWDGPIGLDGRYLHCKLTLTITEVAEEPLSFDVVKDKDFSADAAWPEGGMEA